MTRRVSIHGYMRKRALATCLLVLAWPGTASAAAPTPPASSDARSGSEEVLDEVTVEARRRGQRKPQQSFDWLARLVGEYTIDGYVLPDPDGLTSHSRDARGHALCVGFGFGPAVQCEVRIRWPDVTGPDGEEVPGGVSTLDGATMLFGFNLGSYSDPMNKNIRSYAGTDPESFTIAHILVDNKGVAEGGSGFRMGTDTMTSRAPCVAIPENCQRLVRIIVPGDRAPVEMRIDLEIDGAVAMRYDFLLHRIEDSPAVVYGRKPTKEQKAKGKKK